MNNSDIQINVEELSSTIGNLQKLKDELVNILDVQKDLVEKLPDFYGGTSGETAFNKLKKHSDDNYEKYINEIDERIEFLNNTILAYQKMDSNINAKIDENNNISVLR